MATINSPNMNLPVPVVGQEPGPNYATDVNNSLNTIDSHDHSPGKGVKINPAGIDINASLNMNDEQLTNVASVNLAEQSTTSATLGALYSAPGSGTGISDLWFTDFAGNTIQITKSGLVNVTVSSIPGESYGAGKFTWQQISPDNAGAPALFDTGSITLRPDVVGTTYGTTLVGSTSNSVTINLPLPQTEGYSGVPNFVTMDQSGNQANTYYLDNSTLNASGNAIQIKPGGITSTQISSSAGITGSQLSSSANITGSQLSSSAGIVGGQIASQTITLSNEAALSSYTNSSTTNYSNSTSTLTTIVSSGSHTFPVLLNQRPVMINFSGQGILITPTTFSGSETIATFIVRQTSGAFPFNVASFTFNINPSSSIVYISPASFNCLANLVGTTGSSATATFQLEASVTTTAGGTGNISCPASGAAITIQVTQI